MALSERRLSYGGQHVVFLIIGTIAGMLLGLRFKVFVLIPAILIATGVTIASGYELKMIALTVLGTAVSLQIGYLMGCIVRVMAPAYLPVRITVTPPPSDYSSNK